MEEIEVVIDLINLINKTHPNEKNRQPNVLHSEPGLMYTIKMGDSIYKAIKVDKDWKLNELK